LREREGLMCSLKHWYLHGGADHGLHPTCEEREDHEEKRNPGHDGGDPMLSP
jgi:hypothetical protein